ncbi:hypothetical protein [Maribellus sp. YY47]|uniref:hypothetical protein n=1 Tax=Maribellus sp. YY47 TaxID=2929486 RepID=UPI0020011380|nr:hypothetical protein [Maribellus sp. YY47]MCK3684911.1 hypothetical protein [Maribellus sp. YY47]
MRVFFVRTFICIFLILNVNAAFSQRSSGLAVEGKISVEDGTAEGAIIQMYRDGQRLDNYGVGADGNYKVELSYNHKYELVFEHAGHFSQKIAVETAVPKAILDSDPRFPPFPVDITLFTEIPGIDASFSENNILKIFYSPSVDNFVKELYYNDAQIKKLIEQAVMQAQIVDKRADYMAKLTRAELAELRQEYNKLLEQAGKEYSDEQFLDALDGYKAASKIFPKEQFPKDRINEINDLLGLIMAAEELDKAMLERFDKLVKEGDLLFGQRNYSDAKNSYNRALSIKPFDQYVNDQVKKITALQKQQLEEREYQELIANGDKSIKEMLYTEALGLFQKALEIKPNEQYPKTKINEINGLIADQARDAEKQKDYKEAMMEGERQFSKQFYDRALTQFENALTYKPGDLEATRRIEDTKKIMQGILDQMSFDRLVAEGDKAYKKEDYPTALTNYEEALILVPNEPRTTKRVEEIRELLYIKENIENYLTEGDKKFNEQKYPDSKALFEKALELDGKNEHARERIAEINRIVSEMEVDARYAQVLASADDQMAGKNYELARNGYTEALGIKPNEAYPKQKLAEIGDILAAIAKTNADYQNAVANADRLFQQKNYPDARTAFANAAKIKPEETYPAEMMGKIDGLVAEQTRLAQEAAEAEAARLAAIQAEKDKNYADAIARADNLFNEKDYEKSRTEYRAALEIKPEESYAQQRIDEIGNVLAQLSAAQKAYEDAVAKADREFKAESWEAAIAAYNEAKNAKSEETYPDEQLAKIDSIVTTRERLAKEAAEAEAARLAAIQAEKDKNYADAIARADKLFNDKDYEKSRTEYRAALEIKPEESYAQQRIDEIGNVLAQLSAAQKAYEDAVAKADREFKAESWEAAIAAYNEAKNAKSEETYPDEQLAKIDSIVTTRERLAKEAAEAEAARLAAIQAEKDKNYADAIARADKLFNDKDYEKSRTEYRAALEIKPEESYAQQRIDEIGNVLAQLSATQKAYEDAVAKADREFKAESWEAAIAAYNEAKNAKAEETYPDEQLAKIDSIVTNRERLAKEAAEAEAARLAAIQAEKDKNYADAIARADNLFNEKDYEKSRTEYRAAMDIKPEESYAQQRIDEIGRIVKELADAKAAQDALNRQYANLIQQADRLFNANSYTPAKENYVKAADLKPEEVYPKDKIAEIDRIMEQRALDEKYRNVIVVADGFFRTQKYSDARVQYEIAMAVKPEEEYPKSQIRKIDEMLAQAEARKQSEADAAADVERRRANIAKMQEELDEQKILAESGLNALYDQLIIKADAFFEDKQYNVSRAWYFKALDLKPEEAYPQKRIDEINRLLSGMIISERDREYQRFIDLADTNFRESELAVARGWYNQALGQKPEQQYPKEQLAEIERLVQERLQGRSAERVVEINATAKKAFEDGDITIARFWYKKALLLDPANQEARDGLNATRN